MPRGRPKGWKKMSVYERTKVKRIRDILSQKGISKFDTLRDSQLLQGIYINSDGEIFVKYGLPGTKKRGRQQTTSEGVKILNTIEKNLVALREIV